MRSFAVLSAPIAPTAPKGATGFARNVAGNWCQDLDERQLVSRHSPQFDHFFEIHRTIPLNLCSWFLRNIGRHMGTYTATVSIEKARRVLRLSPLFAFLQHYLDTLNLNLFKKSLNYC
jgi:hypothetical protein